MIRNSIFISLDSFFGGTGGTGGTPQELTRTGGTDRWDQCAQGCPRGSAIFHDGPTGPTVRYHQKSAKLTAVPLVPPVPPGITLSCLGVQKRVTEILELRRPLVEDLTVLAQSSCSKWNRAAAVPPCTQNWRGRHALAPALQTAPRAPLGRADYLATVQVGDRRPY